MGSPLGEISLGVCCLFRGGWVKHIWMGGKGRASVWVVYDAEPVVTLHLIQVWAGWSR